MEGDPEVETRDEVAAQQRRAELAEMRAPFLSMVRYLRAARRQNPETLLQLIEQMHLVMGELLDRRGLIEVGLAAAHLRSGKDDILDYSPMDDPALFSLFQAGVRQISFHPGLSLEELTAFLEVVATDLTTEENEEEDLSTLLESKQLEAIQLVIIETFFESEADRAEGDHRMEDVQALIEAATRQSLSVDSADGAGGGTIRFFDADAEFFRSAELPALLAALTKVGEGGEENSLTDDPEIIEFAEALRMGLERCVDELPTPALAVLDTVEGRDAERVASVLSREVNASASRLGIVSVAHGLDVIDDWLLAQPRGTLRTMLTERVFTRELRLLAMADLDAGGHKAALARRILSQTPESELPRALRDAAKLAFGEGRQHAFEALLGSAPEGFALAAKLIESEPDADLAADVLTPFAHAPLSSGTLGLFRAGLVYEEPEIQLRALSWFVHHGGDHAVGALGDALRSPVAAIRLGGLLLLVERRADVARTILKIWFDSDDFSTLSFDERRRVMLVLARRMGDRLAPELRAQATQNNLLRRQKVDEERAIALAGLGLLVDDEVLELARKYERSPFSGEALRLESTLVRIALESGATPYEDPLPLCYDELRDLALLGSVLASEPIADGMTALHSGAGTRLAATMPRTHQRAPAAPEPEPVSAPPASELAEATQFTPQSAPEPAPKRAPVREPVSEPAPDIGIDLGDFDEDSAPLELANHSFAEPPAPAHRTDADRTVASASAPVMRSFGKPPALKASVVPPAPEGKRPSDLPSESQPTLRPPSRALASDDEPTGPAPTLRPPHRTAEASQTLRPPSRAARVSEPDEELDDELRELMADFSFELEDPTGPGRMA